MKWSDDYRIGIEHIDQQHRGFFTITNRVLSILEDESAQRRHFASKEAIKYLKSYTLEHFTREEEYQRQIGYVNYEEHKKLHDAFAKQVAMKEAQLVESDYSSDSVRGFVDMILLWLVNHIMYEDQKIAWYLEQQNAPPSLK